MRRFKQYTVEEYLKYLRGLKLTRKISEVHLHHTWRPTKAGYEIAKDKEKVIWSMWQYHTKANGWSDIGQHISLAPDGTIWDGRDVNQIPASIKGRNAHGFAIEMIGNFDIGYDKLEGVQLESLLKLLRGLFEIFKTDQLVFHREYSQKTCPGTSIKKGEILKMIHEENKDWRVTQGFEVIDRLDKKIMTSPEYWKDLIKRNPDYGPLLGLIEKMCRK